MKKILLILMVVITSFCLTGCIKRDNMENITIYTTNYPTEYITKRLYGKFSKVKSIYPDGVNIETYKLTNKQISDYSKSDLFIFNGLSDEKVYVTKMRDVNKDLKIIDTTLSMEYDNSIEEVWLDPSNFLMVAQNIKAGLDEYIDSYYLNSYIDEQYEKLKIEASNLDAEFKNVISGGNTNVIVCDNNMFKYLEKYGLDVYVLDDKNNDFNKVSNEVKNLVRQGKIKYIFVKNNEDVSKGVKEFAEENNLEIKKWNTLSNISEIERSENKDYFSIMNENLDLLKDELYK